MAAKAIREWKVERAMIYGAGIGIAAAAFKLLAPWGARHSVPASLRELVGAALAFALLCGVVALVRNLIARRLIRSEIQ